MTDALSWNLHGNDQLSQILERLDKTLTRVGKQMDGTAADARKMGRQLGQVEDDAKKSTSALDDTGDAVGRLGEALKTGAAAAGAAIVAGAAVGITVALQRDDLAARLTAQLRATPEEAEKFGTVAGEVYARGFGEGLEEVTAGVRAVLSNIHGLRQASAKDIEDIAGKAMALADTFELDVGGAARAAGKLIDTGLVKNAKEAFDLLAAGFSGSNLDQAGDLLDTISEYSTQFRQLGIEGPKALGLLRQGLAAGARDADTVADAIKEFAIRSQDGSTLSAKAFKTLGLNAKDMFKVFAAGGPDADAAMKRVIDRLKGIRDPALRNATAVALFGTKAEDLQQALYALDPTTAVAALGEVSGAATELGDNLQGSGLRALTEYKRRAEMLLGDVADAAIGAAGKLKEELKPIADRIKNTFKDSDVPDKTMASLRELGDKVLPKLVESFDKLATTAEENKEGLEKFGRFCNDVLIPVLGVSTIYAINSITFTLETLIKATSAVTSAFQLMTLYTLNSLGFLVDAAANSLGWLPGIGKEIKNARTKFHEFSDGVINDLKKLDGRSVDVYVRTHLTGSGNQGFAAANRRAVGGPVWAGETYEVGERGVERFYAARTGVIQSNAQVRGASSGGGDGVLGTLIVKHVNQDGEEIRTELLKLKRRRGLLTLDLA